MASGEVLPHRVSELEWSPAKARKQAASTQLSPSQITLRSGHSPWGFSDVLNDELDLFAK